MKRTRFVTMLGISVPVAISIATAAPMPAIQPSTPSQPQTQRASPQTRSAEVVFPDRTRVRAEVAATEAERERGLMLRTSLGELDGMIFVFDAPGLHAFW